MINSLPNNKILDWSKFKVSADKKINVTEKLIFCLGTVENVGKGESADFQHYLLFLQCSPKSSIGSLKVRTVWQKFKPPVELLEYNVFLLLHSYLFQRQSFAVIEILFVNGKQNKRNNGVVVSRFISIMVDEWYSLLFDQSNCRSIQTFLRLRYITILYFEPYVTVCG